MTLGNEAYKAGDWWGAIDAYTAILDAGYENADLYYNLGNAYYRIERYGMAILNYERALLLEPNFAEAKQNLALANARTEDKITPLPEFLLARWYRALYCALSFDVWFAVLLILAALALIAAAVMLSGGNYRWRKTGFIVLIIMAVLWLVSLCCTISSAARLNRHDRAVITQPMVVVKGSPDASGVDKLVLHDGALLTIDETLDGWHKVRLADGNTGWLPVADVTVI
jgi:tetratricopeptide (TPR) repeat protein